MTDENVLSRQQVLTNNRMKILFDYTNHSNSTTAFWSILTTAILVRSLYLQQFSLALPFNMIHPASQYAQTQIFLSKAKNNLAAYDR
jgi:hypothetical protein